MNRVLFWNSRNSVFLNCIIIGYRGTIYLMAEKTLFVVVVVVLNRSW